MEKSSHRLLEEFSRKDSKRDDLPEKAEAYRVLAQELVRFAKNFVQKKCRHSFHPLQNRDDFFSHKFLIPIWKFAKKDESHNRRECGKCREDLSKKNRAKFALKRFRLDRLRDAQ